MAFDNEFTRAKSKGKIGERLVAEYYRGLGYSVIDVSENKQYQRNDIDFFIDGISIEVKTQNCLKENNICLELISNVERGYQGWFHTTAAQDLIFVDDLNKILYKIGTENLREYYYKNKSAVQERVQYNMHKTSIICFIPLVDLKDITERIEL